MTSSSNAQRTTLFLDPSIVKHAKAEAIIEEITLTALVEQALLKYLPAETKIRKIAIKEPVYRQNK
jgi:hypothetical protein